MAISMYGGPFDGARTPGPDSLPVYLIARNHCDHPIYKRACSCSANSLGKIVPYVFVGYEADSHRWLESDLEQVSLESA
ncbi:MAG: hypothetical protein R3C24_03095 [Cyanobacteriota/Melainabacteria group bacterium]